MFLKAVPSALPSVRAALEPRLRFLKGCAPSPLRLPHSNTSIYSRLLDSYILPLIALL